MMQVLEQALKALNDHQVIAFPTETVFGMVIHSVKRKRKSS